MYSGNRLSQMLTFVCKSSQICSIPHSTVQYRYKLLCAVQAVSMSSPLSSRPDLARNVEARQMHATLHHSYEGGAARCTHVARAHTAPPLHYVIRAPMRSTRRMRKCTWSISVVARYMYRVTMAVACQSELEVALVDSRRWRILTKTCNLSSGKGPVVYWMSRDQRVQGNCDRGMYYYCW